MFLPHPLVKLSIIGSLRGREVACSTSDLQGLNFEACVWRVVSSHSSHHPQRVLLAQFSLYVHKSGLKPDLFNFLFATLCDAIDVGLMLDKAIHSPSGDQVTETTSTSNVSSVVVMQKKVNVSTKKMNTKKNSQEVIQENEHSS